MSVFKNPLHVCGGKIEKIASEIKIPFAKYSVFLGKSVLRNYIIISLQCVAYARR